MKPRTGLFRRSAAAIRRGWGRWFGPRPVGMDPAEPARHLVGELYGFHMPVSRTLADDAPAMQATILEGRRRATQHALDDGCLVTEWTVQRHESEIPLSGQDPVTGEWHEVVPPDVLLFEGRVSAVAWWATAGRVDGIVG